MERKLSLLLLGIDWINGSNNQQSYSCVMSCPTSHLGLTEINDGETIVCSIPVTMKGPEEIVPIDLNLSNDHQATLTRIVKVISSLSLRSVFPISSLGYSNQISYALIIPSLPSPSHRFLFVFFLQHHFLRAAFFSLLLDQIKPTYCKEFVIMFNGA